MRAFQIVDPRGVGVGGTLEPPSGGASELGVIRIEPHEANNQGSGTAITNALGFGNLDACRFNNGQNNLFDVLKSFPPTWRGETIGLWIDWHVRSATATGVVRWRHEIEYRGDEEGQWSASTFDVGPIDSDFNFASADPDNPRMTKLADITWTSTSTDVMFYLRITRRGADAGDTYGNLAYLNEIVIGPNAEISDAT